MKAYQFAVLRYVHDVSAQEFVNIGLVFWVPENGRLWSRLNERYGRLSTFYKDFDGVSFRELIRHLSSQFESAAQELQTPDLFTAPPKGLGEILNSLLPEDASCFQWSPVMSGINSNPDERAEQLFEEFVLRHEPGLPREQRDENIIWRDVFKRVSGRGLATKVQQDVPVRSRYYSYNFRMGWRNGRLQVLEPISFDLVNLKSIIEKANKWAGRLLNLQSDNDFQMTAVVARPQQAAIRKAFDQGCAMLKNAPSVRHVLTEDEVSDFISEIEKEVG